MQAYSHRGQKQFQETSCVPAKGWCVPGLISSYVAISDFPKFYALSIKKQEIVKNQRFKLQVWTIKSYHCNKAQ